MSARWKVVERKVAQALGGVRTPLSGKNSHLTGGDVVHDTYYVEVKSDKAVLPRYALDTFAEAEKNAFFEGKIPLVVLHRKHLRGMLVLLTLEDFVTITGDKNEGKNK